MEPTTAWVGAFGIAFIWFIPGYAAAAALRLKGMDRIFAAPMFGMVPYLLLFFLHKSFTIPINAFTTTIIVWAVVATGAFYAMLKSDGRGYYLQFPEFVEKIQAAMDEGKEELDAP